MKFYRFAILSLSVIGMTGCFAGSYTGGGWTVSPADPDAKATFGGNFQAIDEDGDGEVFDPFVGFDSADTFRGQFQYNDHGADVAFHGVVDGGYISPNDFVAVLPGTLPEQWSVPGAGFLEGTYKPIPAKRGPGGRFQALVIDNGEPGSSAGDEIWIVCTSGVFAGYNNDNSPFPLDDGIFGQELQGGNLDYHPPED